MYYRAWPRAVTPRPIPSGRTDQVHDGPAASEDSDDARAPADSVAVFSSESISPQPSSERLRKAANGERVRHSFNQKHSRLRWVG
jgi:hypothetical protein